MARRIIRYLTAPIKPIRIGEHRSPARNAHSDLRGSTLMATSNEQPLVRESALHDTEEYLFYLLGRQLLHGQGGLLA